MPEVKISEKVQGNEWRRTKKEKGHSVIKETEVKANEKQLQEDINHANRVFEEANKRLTNGIKDKNFSEIDIAQCLLEVATKNIDQARAVMEKMQKTEGWHWCEET